MCPNTPDAGAAASLLQELVTFDTINSTGNELELCNFLIPHLEELGADEVRVGTVPPSSRRDAEGAYVLARFGTPDLVINAHVDTVPANHGWTRPPLEPYIDQGRLYGLGSADTKGAIACAIAAANRVKPRDVLLLFSGDEENTSTVLPEVVARGELDGVTTAIVCEPTNRRAGIRHRGILAHQARIAGRGGHSSHADHLPKPIVTMSRLAVAIDDLAVSFLDAGIDGMTGLCVNVASIDGGVAMNVVPEWGGLTVSCRPPPGFDLDSWRAALADAARSVDADIEIEELLDQRAFIAADEGALRELVGEFPVSVGSLDFWTEAAVFADAGINAVVIGPGNIEQAHRADEFVTLSDLQWAEDLFVSVFKGRT